MELEVAVVSLFVAHWVISLFFHSFFLHRYGAHEMFSMRPSWERFFHVCTYVALGSSYMSPGVYAVMHKMHHAYSDTVRDPHSPTNHRNIFSLMWATRTSFADLEAGRVAPEARFVGGAPRWMALEDLGNSWASRIAWGIVYASILTLVVSEPWQWVFLPMHIVIGPMQGALVNSCGHRFGYRNHALNDESRNTLRLDIAGLGELYQNNHHRAASNPNFAHRWFELDPTYQVIRCLSWLNIVTLRRPYRPNRERSWGHGMSRLSATNATAKSK